MIEGCGWSDISSDENRNDWDGVKRVLAKKEETGMEQRSLNKFHGF